MKCLEKDRTRRYETANGLARDIERHLQHEPVTARPPSSAYRMHKFVRRNKVVVTAAAMIAAALMLGIAISTWQAVRATQVEREQGRQRQRAEENEHRAEQARAKEEAQRQMAERQYYCASIGQVQALIDQGQYGRAQQILGQTNLASFRGWEWGWLERNCSLDLMTLSGGGRELTGVAFSPDGRWLAAGSYDCTVRLWEATTGVERLPFRGHGSTVVLLGFSPDSRRLVSASFDGTAIVWDVVTGQSRFTLTGHSNAVWCAAFSPDGKMIATGSGDHTVRLWDAETGAFLRQVAEGQDIVMCVAFSSDGRRLAYGGGSANTWTRSADNAVRIVDLASGESHALVGHTHCVSGIAFHPNGYQVVTASWDGTARLGDVRTDTELRPFFKMSGLGALLTVAFSPDGCLCALAGGAMGPQKAEAGVHLIEMATHKVVQVFEGHTNWVLAVAFSPNENRVATASADRTVKVWEVTTGRLLLSLSGHSDQVLQVAWSPDGQSLATGAQDSTIRLWNPHTGASLFPPLEGHRDGVSSLAFSPDGRRLATAAGGLSVAKSYTMDDSVFLWEVATGQSVLRLRPHFNVVRAVAFDAEGTRLLTGSVDNTARVHSAFEWRPEDYPGDPGDSSAERFELYTRNYWPKFLAAATNATSPRPGRRLENRILEFNVAVDAPMKTRPAHPIPARNPAAQPNHLDLAPAYNAALDEAWIPAASLEDLDRVLSALPNGLRPWGGVLFDVRGVLQLSRQDPDWSKFPGQVQFTVGRRFRQFHALQGTLHKELDGIAIGCYRLRYADGHQAELEIRYGRDLRDWRDSADSRSLGEHAAVAWAGPR